MFRLMRQSVLVLAFLGLIAKTTDQARAEFVLDAFDTGSYNADGDHDSANKSYITSHYRMFDYFRNMETRSYFVFDLSNVTDDITSATLKIFSPESGAIGSLTYSVYNVFTPVSRLMQTYQSPPPYDPDLIGTARPEIFNDLGTGTVYGTASSLLANATDTYVEISLNSKALADLNIARGEKFAIGGALSPRPSSYDNHYIFGGRAPELGEVQLLLNFKPAAVPEPASLISTSLAAIAGVAYGWRRRRRAKAASGKGGLIPLEKTKSRCTK